MSDVKVFQVNGLSDWEAVAKALMEMAAAQPLDYRSMDYKAKSLSDVWVQAMKMIAAGNDGFSHTIAVIYKQSKLLSMVMTFEPQGIHFSIVRIADNQRMVWIDDDLAKEIVTNVLGDEAVETKEDSVLKEVRHFERKLPVTDQ